MKEVKKQGKRSLDLKALLSKSKDGKSDGDEAESIAYVGLDARGCVAEADPAAVQLLVGPSGGLVGTQFAAYVAKEDAAQFLYHLLCCRSGDKPVETKLRLKLNGMQVPCYLFTLPVALSRKKGAMLYETAIIDMMSAEGA